MAEQHGNLYGTRNGYGIRWREDGQRRYQSGFRTKTEARAWFREQVAPRLRRRAPSAEIRFDDFAELFLKRHTGAPRTVSTLRDRARSPTGRLRSLRTPRTTSPPGGRRSPRAAATG